MSDEPSVPMIVPNKTGEAPSLEEVVELQVKAKEKGLFSEWPYVMVLENGDLLLCCEPQTGEHGAGLIASKRNEQWSFYLDSDFACRQAL